MGSSYAARVLSTRLQTAHSNVCKSMPRARAGSMLTSIIWALHLGQAGRPIAANGMTDDRCWDWGMMLPSNRRERNTLCHRYMPGSDGDDLLCALVGLDANES